VNYIILGEEAKLLASCADDGLILIYNMETYRQETTIKGHEVEVKVCIFLSNSLCLASSDIDGNIFFWKLTLPPVKYKLITRVVNSFVNKENVIDSSLVKAMSFNNDNNLLYTGDNRRVLKVWNCERIINEVKGIESEPKQMEELKTFMTEGVKEETKELVVVEKEIKAHKDGISSVCFIKNPHCIATCWYDCMAYVWTPELKKIGSLILEHNTEFKLKIPKDEWFKQQKEKTIEVLKDAQKLFDESEESESDEEEDKSESGSSVSGGVAGLSITQLWFRSKDDNKEIDEPKAKPNLSRKLYHEKKTGLEEYKKSSQAKYFSP
jgi:WD40 repeat protein